MRIVSRTLKTFLFIVINLAIANSTLASDLHCELEFMVKAAVPHGTIAAGEKLNGNASFKVVSEKVNADTITYMSDGELTVSDGDGGKVSGNIWIVNVARTPYFSDYISIDVKDVQGDLGGIETYFDPMLVTLYTDGGNLATHDLPTDAQGWNALNKNRTFQVHTPTAQVTFFGEPSEFSGECKAF